MSEEKKNIELPITLAWSVLATIAGLLVTGFVNIQINGNDVKTIKGQMLDVEQRVRYIEANRYTADDAKEMEVKILRELDFIRKELEKR